MGFRGLGGGKWKKAIKRHFGVFLAGEEEDEEEDEEDDSENGDGYRRCTDASGAGGPHCVIQQCDPAAWQARVGGR